MATKKPVYEDQKFYEAKLARVEKYKKTVLRPRGSYTLKGRVLNDLPTEAIAEAIPASDKS